MYSETETAFLRERLLRSIAENLRDSNEKDIRLRMKNLGLPYDARFFSVCEIWLKLDKVSPAERDIYISKAQKFFCDGLKKKVAVMPYGSSNGNLALILSSGKSADINKAQECLEKLLADLFDTLGITGLIAIGRTVTTVLDIRLSAADTLSCLTYKYNVSAGNVIHIQDLKRMLRHTTDEHDLATERILGCFLDGNIPKLKKRLNELLDMIEFDKSNNYFALRQTYIELIMRIIRQTSDFGVLLPENEMPDSIQYVFNAAAPSEIELWFINSCIRYVSLVNRQKTDKITRLIEQAKEYVANNYADCNLSQQSAGDYLNLSSAYFGHLFFAKTGSKFLDYVKEYRINTAKELLISSNIKIKDIGTEVGFTSDTYFNTVFKKMTGVTPQEFRGK